MHELSLNLFRSSGTLCVILKIVSPFPYPAFRTAPVQLKVAVGFRDPFGELDPSPGSSSLTAVVNDIRSSSLICQVNTQKYQL